MDAIIKNWKTTTAGVVIIVSLVLVVFKVITYEQFTTVIGTLAGAGLLAAGDGKKEE